MWYADTVGLPTVLARVKEYRERMGDYWQPAALLEKPLQQAAAFTRESRRLPAIRSARNR